MSISKRRYELYGTRQFGPRRRGSRRAATGVSTSYDIEGLKEVTRNLESVGQEVLVPLLKTASRVGAEPVKAATKRNLQGRKKTGAAAKAISIRLKRTKRIRKGGKLPPWVGANVIARDKDLASRGRKQGFFTGKTFYLGFVEFGWKTGSRNNKKGVIYLPSQYQGRYFRRFLSVNQRNPKRRQIPAGGWLGRPPFATALKQTKSASVRAFIASISRGFTKARGKDYIALRRQARQDLGNDQ